MSSSMPMLWILPEGGFILVFTGSLGVWAAAKQNRGSTAGVRTIMITSVIVIIVIIMKTIINFISNFLFIKKCSSFQWMLLLLLLLVSESVGSILLLLYRQPALHRLQVDSSDFVLFLLFSSIPFNFYILFVLQVTMLSRCIYSTNWELSLEEKTTSQRPWIMSNKRFLIIINKFWREN